MDICSSSSEYGSSEMLPAAAENRAVGAPYLGEGVVGDVLKGLVDLKLECFGLYS